MHESEIPKSSDISNNGKKRQAENEVIKVTKRSSKTKYFFQPVNKLTNGASNSSNQPSNTKAKHHVQSQNILDSIDSNIINSTIQPVQPAKSPSKENHTSNNENVEIIIRDNQSSDDSFDGIKWRVSPRRYDQTKSKEMQSSPLKNLSESNQIKDNGSIELEGTNSHDEVDSPINEQTNSVLSKYGTGLHNVLSQTPGFNRSFSDISDAHILEKQDLPHRKPPSLLRAKSSGFDIINASKEILKTKQTSNSSLNTSRNTLNNWIDKFEDSNPTDSPIPVQSSLIVKDIHGSFPSSPTSDDPFSDDDSEIIAATTKQPVHKEEILNEITTSVVEKDDSDDPFTDDDSELMQIISKPESKLLTSETAKYSKSFQDGIKRFEELQMEKGSFTKSKVNNELQVSYSKRDLKRYQVINEPAVINSSPSRKSLRVIDIENNIVDLELGGDSAELNYKIGDIVHVYLTEKESPHIIDDKHNLLIWHPDILLPATTVSKQISCPRKSVLMNRFKFPGGTSIPIIVGDIIHSIFQDCIFSENWDLKHLGELRDHYIELYLLSIFSIGPKVEDVRKDIDLHLPYLESWFKKYYKKKYLTNEGSIESVPGNAQILFSASEALDIEENIWSPAFGLKGKADVTLEARLQNKNTDGTFLIPMEIKTGREHISHYAQASLYSFLFKDKYEMDISSFLLVYTKEQLTKKCDISVNDLKSLIHLRNTVVQYFKDGVTELPALQKNSECNWCEIKPECMTIHQLAENGTAETSGIKPEEYEEIIGGLKEKSGYNEFFSYWIDIITQEESMQKHLTKHIWMLTSKQREEREGMAVGGFHITETNDTSSLQKQFRYTFERSSSNPSILNSHLMKSDRVIISDESNGIFSIAPGDISSISHNKIVITTPRRLITSDFKLKNFDASNNQIVHGVLHSKQNIDSKSLKTFRIDKDELFYGLGLAKYNILNLFLADGDKRIRKAIIENAEPTFSKVGIPYTLSEDKYNPDQLKAFESVLTANDFSLILGMPGTGKTTVIAQLIKILVENKKTVFLSAYTNSAVDNILLKIQELGVDFLRLGHPSRVHSKIRHKVPSFFDKSISTYEDFQKVYLEPYVVAATCLGVNDVTFNLRDRFDYCIIDEASQASMPMSLGPLRFADKFVLVGDHYQLPPLVLHPDPNVKKGLSQSLFKSLAEKYPKALVELTYQYRMCDEIMQLSNILVYNNRLKCGSEATAKQYLEIPNASNLIKYSNSPIPPNDTWINKILDPNCKVLFLDHDKIPALERTFGEYVENKMEAELVRQTVEALLACGVEESRIGVMTFNTGQLRLLNRILHGHEEVEILTADRFQGRDKDCIILSFVRSNAENKAGDLVRDWRRVNVAITRAKSKLILLGSKSTLSNAETIKTFMDLLSSKGWIYELPADAAKLYSFPNSGQRESQKKNLFPSQLLSNSPIIKDIYLDMTT